MHIAHLARAENELLASLLKDELRFVLRKHVRRAVILLRQLLLPLHDIAGEANDHVARIGLSVNRYGAECGAFDLHGLILVSKRTKIVPSRWKYITRVPFHGRRDAHGRHRNQNISNAPAVNKGGESDHTQHGCGESRPHQGYDVEVEY